LFLSRRERVARTRSPKPQALCMGSESLVHRQSRLTDRVLLRKTSPSSRCRWHPFCIGGERGSPLPAAPLIKIATPTARCCERWHFQYYFGLFFFALVASKLALVRNATTSSGASGRSTEIQWSLFM